MIKSPAVLTGLIVALLIACGTTTTERIPIGEAYSDTLSHAMQLVESRQFDDAALELQRITALPASHAVQEQAQWRLHLIHKDRGESMESFRALIACLEHGAISRSPLYGRTTSSLGPATVEVLESGAKWAILFDLLGQIEDVDVLLELSAYLVEAGDCYPASTLLGRLARQGIDPGHEHRCARLAKQTAQCLERTSLTLALIVPLTGDYAEYGGSLARGAELALLDSSLHGALFLEKIDSRSDPVEATISVQRAAASPHVLTAIGPLQSRAGTGAATAASNGELPVLIPIPAPQGLSRLSEWIFQNAVPVQAEARAVAKYAMIEAGISRFAILYPSHATGEQAMDAFKIQVNDLGGEIVATERYSEDRDTDFRNQIVNIKRASPQALFVPGQPRELVQISRQVAFYELECHLLGTEGWNSEEVIGGGGRFVEGAIFSDLADVAQTIYHKDLFRARFLETYGRDPDHYAFIGFDLAFCVRRAVEDGCTSRKALRRYLEDLTPINGVSGVLSWRTDDAPGTVQLLTIADGLVVPLSLLRQGTTE